TNKRRVNSGAAALVTVTSGVTRLGYCAKPQPTRMRVTCPIAASRATTKRRSQRAINAAPAKRLVHASSTGAHQRVNSWYIAAAPRREVRKTAWAIGAGASPDHEEWRHKSYCRPG